MEIDLQPPLDYTDSAQQQRFAELSLRSYLITLHEQLAQAWEQGELADQASRDTDWHKRQRELVAMYEEDVGVHPRDRRQLERQIETCISDGSRETLSAIIALVRGQSQNGSTGAPASARGAGSALART